MWWWAPGPLSQGREQEQQERTERTENKHIMNDRRWVILFGVVVGGYIVVAGASQFKVVTFSKARVLNSLNSFN